MNERQNLGTEVFIWSVSEFLINSAHSRGVVMDDTQLKSLELWGSVMCCSNMPVKL